MFSMEANIYKDMYEETKRTNAVLENHIAILIKALKSVNSCFEKSEIQEIIDEALKEIGYDS